MQFTPSSGNHVLYKRNQILGQVEDGTVDNHEAPLVPVRRQHKQLQGASCVTGVQFTRYGHDRKSSLVLSERSVEKHIANILTKLNLAPSETDNRRLLAVLRYLSSS